MCDFKVGDEVVCVDASNVRGYDTGIVVGGIYRVEAVDILSGTTALTGERATRAGLLLDGFRSRAKYGHYDPRRFRKVQRRNLQEWLSQSVGNTDKLDNRQKEAA